MRKLNLTMLIEETAEEILSEELLTRVVDDNIEAITDESFSKFNRAIAEVDIDTEIDKQVKGLISIAMDNIDNESLKLVIMSGISEKVEEYISDTF